MLHSYITSRLFLNSKKRQVQLEVMKGKRGQDALKSLTMVLMTSS